MFRYTTKKTRSSRSQRHSTGSTPRDTWEYSAKKGNNGINKFELINDLRNIW